MPRGVYERTPQMYESFREAARNRTPEHQEKLDEARRNRSPEMNAELGRRQRRSDARYIAAHDRIRSDRGRASEYDCIDCGAQAEQWAFRNDTPTERVLVEPVGRDAGSRYSLDPMDYDPRCRSCHRRYDG